MSRPKKFYSLRSKAKTLSHEEICKQHPQIAKWCTWVEKQLAEGKHSPEETFWNLSRIPDVNIRAYEYIHKRFFTSMSKYNNAVAKITKLVEEKAAKEES